MVALALHAVNYPVAPIPAGRLRGPRLRPDRGHAIDPYGLLRTLARGGRLRSAADPAEATDFAADPAEAGGPAEIAAALRLIVEPGQVVELRALDVSTPAQRRPHTVAGYFDYDHLGDLAETAWALSPHAKGCYFTLNPLAPDLIHRLPNAARTVSGSESAGDVHVLRRRWLLVDADPERLAGISASAAEKAAARETLCKLVGDLTGEGWPAPIVADSGNGWHALYRIDLPNDDAAKALVKGVLAALAAKYDDAAVGIDPAVFNAARICKLYGTWGRKGGDTPDRPHRLAHIATVPGALEIVSRERLESIAAARPAEAPPRPRAEGPKGKGARKDRSALGRAAAYVAKMPPAVAGEGGSKAAYTVAAKLVIGFGLSPDDALPIFRDYSERCTPPWTDAELKHKLADADKLADERGTMLADADADEKGPNDAQRLLDLASAAELWRTPEPKPYATIPVGEHRENHPLHGSSFKRWLMSRFYHSTGRAPSPETLRSAIAILGVRADEGTESPVFVRTAEAGPPDAPTFYLDLANDRWEAVAIDRTGWRVVSDPPVKFRRPGGMMALPTPIAGGDLDELRGYINLPDAAAWTLVRSWILAALTPRGPYPILSLTGEQGSAKSTAAAVCRRMVDPHVNPLRSLPKEEGDLWLMGQNSGVLALDNLSYLSDAYSDALCRIATGGGVSKRGLYTDDEEVHFAVRRPILLTGIEDVASRGDLLDRAILIALPKIADADRRTEAEFWRDFGAAHPRLLGAALDAVAGGLRALPTVVLEGKPRMADFAVWAEACGRGLGDSDQAFTTTYAANRDDAAAVGLEGSAFAAAALRLVSDRRDPWKGTAETLLTEVGYLVDSRDRPKSWPKSARGASGQLRRHAPALRRVGIAVEFSQEGHDRTRWIVISPAPLPRATPPGEMDPKEFAAGLLDAIGPGRGHLAMRTVADGADG